MYKKIIKPVVDILVALISLIIISPLFIVVMVLLAISNRGNPFFIQKRPGKNGEIFHIIKFKTMNDKKCEKGRLLSDYERLTFFGKIVRKTSLDELPQLINVLKGDMSLVGPRPLLPEYLPLYNEEQKKRHDVKPGITGWAQVNGFRGEVITDKDVENRLKFDLYYIENWTLFLDIKIILITIKNFILGDEKAY